MQRCDLSGQRILITGCTGFVGRSILRFISSLPVPDRPESVIGLARSPEPLDALAQTYGWFTPKRADCSLPMSPDGAIDLIIHAATPASATLIAEQPRKMADTILATTNVIIDYSRQMATPPTVLFTSSGAVHNWSNRTQAVAESDRSAPPTNDPKSCYGEAKRMSEVLFNLADQDGSCRSRIARLFAFAGPDLPLDAHFAIGNFVNDVLRSRPIRVNGHPDTIRSYMWHDDMSRWLFAIALNGSSGTPYNVGSDKAIRIADLATTIAHAASRLGKQSSVEFAADGINLTPSFYVPDTTFAQTTLGLQETHEIDGIAERMISHFTTR